MDAELYQAVKDVGEAAKARNAAAGDKMYCALVSIREALNDPHPSIEYIRAVVARAIPK